MASEEQYLDDLLNNAINSEPKERSMKDVMRNMGIVIEEPETVVEEPAPVEEIPAEEPAPEISAITQETLADMLDVLEDPSTYMDEVLPIDSVEEIVNEDNISEFLSDEPIIDEPQAEAQEETLADEIGQDGLDALLAGFDMPEEPAVEEIPVEESVSEEELPVMEDIPAMEEVPAEEPAPVEQMNQDDLDAMLAGLDLPEEPETEEIATEEDIPAIDDISMEEIPAAEEEFPTTEDIISDSENLTDDDLLKMLGEATTAEDFVMPESRMTGESEEPNPDEASQDDLAAMLGESNQDDLAAMLGESNQDDLAAMLGESSQDDLAAMLGESNQDDLAAMLGESNQDDLAAMLGDSSQDDLAAMLGEEAPVEQTSEPKTDLNDVEKLEATGESDEDLLALLEGIDPSASGETSEDSSNEINELLSDSEQIIEPYDADGKLPKPKKKFKGFSLPFFGKKKKKAETVEGNIDDGVIAGTADEIDNILAGMEQAENPDNEGAQEIDLAEAMGDLDELAGIKEKKKPGFFARLLAFLTEDLDEPEEEVKPMDEFSNDDILAEVDAEAAVEEKKTEKKSKKSKKDKKKKGAAEESSEDGEGEEGDEAAEDTSKKKKKKEKKVKEPKEPKPKEPKKIVLSKKASIGLFAFCVTLIAAIVILSNILPDYTQKLEARKAYYQGDYRTVYANFMNKQLNDSDTIIFKRAETIMKLQRRLDSYNNRIAMGQDAEALDSLFEGVYVYQKLITDDIVDVANDLIPIYSQITEILKNKYGISSDEAFQIYNIDDDTEYTRILFEIVRTGSYSLTTEPQEEDLPLMEPAADEENESVDENTENTSEDVSTDDSIDDSEYSTIELEDMLPGEEDLL